MKKLLYIYMLLAVLLVIGCGRERYAHLAEQLCKNGKEDAAAVEYEHAVLAGESPHEAYVWLADYYDGNGRNALKAVLYARQALKTATTLESSTLKVLLVRNEKRLYDELLQHNIQDCDDNLQTKVKLLEEHARNQASWLEELRRENAQLRRELGEQQ